MKYLGIIVMALLMIVPVFAGVVSAADDLDVTYIYSDNVRQEETGEFGITIENIGSDQIRITWIGIHFDWLDDGVYYRVDYQADPQYIASTHSDSTTISFSVDSTVEVGDHSFHVLIQYDEDEMLGWTFREWESQTSYGYTILEVDGDNDGVADSDDAFPDNSQEWSDSDLDGVGNNADAFPYDSTEWKDSDNDGVGDNTDYYPNDSTQSVYAPTDDSSPLNTNSNDDSLILGMEQSDFYMVSAIFAIVVIGVIVVALLLRKPKVPVQQQPYQYPPPPPPQR